MADPFPLEYNHITVRRDREDYVVGNNHNHVLGFIEYHEGWNEYVFYPMSDNVFSTGCLESIQDAINRIESYEEDAS